MLRNYRVNINVFAPPQERKKKAITSQEMEDLDADSMRPSKDPTAFVCGHAFILTKIIHQNVRPENQNLGVPCGSRSELGRES
jgi:hypothetical protein